MNFCFVLSVAASQLLDGVLSSCHVAFFTPPSPASDFIFICSQIPSPAKIHLCSGERGGGVTVKSRV